MMDRWERIEYAKRTHEDMRKRGQPRPRRPPAKATQLRLAYLEGVFANLEGDILAPPHGPGPLRKEWLRGWHYSEETFVSAEAVEAAENYIEELESREIHLEGKIEDSEADIALLTKGNKAAA